MTTLGVPRITRLKIDGIPPFEDSVEFRFDPEVNLFIGPNATGKSTILKLLAPYFPVAGIPGYDENLVDIRVDSWPVSPDRRPDDDAVPQIYFPPVRHVAPVPEGNVRISRPPVGDDWSDWEHLLDEVPYSYFDSGRVYHALQKLYQEDLSDEPPRTRGATVSHTVDRCVQDICREVLRGTSQNITTNVQLHIRSHQEQLPDELLRQQVQHYGVAVNTVESEEVPLYLGELSTGTQGLYWWVCFLALKLGSHYRFESGWYSQPGILFIDEIENHLHPTWQRRIIPALRRRFPGLQIFATTHSPFVVAGLKRGQIHRLYREKGAIKTDKLTDEEKEQKIEGWTVEEILREFMEVDDPTDAETAENAATLRWLREQLPPVDQMSKAWIDEKIVQLQANPERTRDEEEALYWLSRQFNAGNISAREWREETLTRLRSAISRDLEAGGPFAAQRELFIEQLRQLLSDDESEEEQESEG